MQQRGACLVVPTASVSVISGLAVKADNEWFGCESVNADSK